MLEKKEVNKRSGWRKKIEVGWDRRTLMLAALSL
jgi:hypothetical protein